jgi:hypothetical protein
MDSTLQIVENILVRPFSSVLALATIRIVYKVLLLNDHYLVIRVVLHVI